MRRFCTILICFVCITLCNAFATDGSPLPTVTDDQSDPETEDIDIAVPLFDYPISRALGIDVTAMLAPPVATSWFDVSFRLSPVGGGARPLAQKLAPPTENSNTVESSTSNLSMGTPTKACKGPKGENQSTPNPVP